jgi:hypothetical protein
MGQMTSLPAYARTHARSFLLPFSHAFKDGRSTLGYYFIRQASRVSLPFKFTRVLLLGLLRTVHRIPDWIGNLPNRHPICNFISSHGITLQAPSLVPKVFNSPPQTCRTRKVFRNTSMMPRKGQWCLLGKLCYHAQLHLSSPPLLKLLHLDFESAQNLVVLQSLGPEKLH